ncbi:metallophosphoesterase [uncultured Selenomonas sp.]|uniref:metallophosphoesterase n=1 Tax=uncultured Selenomonas sp. TaxID=159275 RepID=UPI0028DB72C2|nr:metallophosphoesterase [uncultured Selenomonas sp.]
MIAFLILLIAVLSMFTAAALWALRYILDGRALLVCRAAVVCVFAIAVASFLVRRNPFALLLSDGTTVSLASVFFLALMFLFLLVVASVIFRFVYRRMLAVPEDGERRRVLKAAGVYPVAALGVALYGNLCERNATVERRYDVPVAARSLSGYTVAQLSDVHLGMFFSLDRLARLLRQVADAAPDALLLTGDIFDHPEWTVEAVQLIDSFAAAFPGGIWYCHGNHEHIRGIALVEEALAGSKIRFLKNEARCVRPGETPLYFAGVDYPMSEYRQRLDTEAFQREKAAFAKAALEAIPTEAVTVLLAHHPEFIDDGAAYGARLVLTGHTHGSQFGIFGIPLFPVFKYTRGIVEKEKTMGYVHSGNGSWFPYRLGCPPEIAYFRFTPCS